MIARETGEGDKRVLPVWHNVTADEVRHYSPTLASLLAISTAQGLERVAASVIRVLEGILRRERSVENFASSRALVLEQWLIIEKTIEQIAERYSCFGSPNSYMVRRLNEIGVVNNVLMAAYTSLRRFRDEAVHNQRFSLSTDEANRYLARAQSLLAALLQLI